jgi:hypothetical protein
MASAVVKSTQLDTKVTKTFFGGLFCKTCSTYVGFIFWKQTRVQHACAFAVKYYDGVIWVTVGQTPSILALQAQLLQALTQVQTQSCSLSC